MIVGIPKESFHDEKRVSFVPQLVPQLIKEGFEVVVEQTAGVAAGFLDAEYKKSGAQIIESREEVFRNADLLIQVLGFGADLEAGRADLEYIRPNHILIGFFNSIGNPHAVKQVGERGATVFAMELMPRITRAQSMDALSSMAIIAGYKAVFLAAEALPKMFPMLMTAAGTITPAKVFIIGAGVAGLNAIAVARRSGAVVRAYDVRPTVKEQVESLGAAFVELPLSVEQSEDKTGYAKEFELEFYRKQQEVMAKVVGESDVVITAAVIPGKKAPVLISREMVSDMAPGSVIVDLAAERGGNCELTVLNEKVTEHGVTILGPLNVASSVAFDASRLYSRNVLSFLQNMLEDGELTIDPEDEIVGGTLVTRNGEVVHPRIKELLSANE